MKKIQNVDFLTNQGTNKKIHEQNVFRNKFGSAHQISAKSVHKQKNIQKEVDYLNVQQVADNVQSFNHLVLGNVIDRFV